VFITALGNDIAGNFIKTESQKLGFDISKWLFLNQNVSTGSYSAILDPFGELMTGCGDMRAHYHISKELVEKHIDDIKNSELVAIDAGNK
jgi:sugar/nucleoside kinase (ribokinase family)